MIIIDYLQLMSGQHRRQGRRQPRAGNCLISRALKGIAKELNVPVLALSQLRARWKPAAATRSRS